MELEVVGRHAMLFDDDANAAFVNSEEALVEWNSIPIDRYDVRHLLSTPPPPRNRRRPAAPHPDASLEPELHRERFLDLPSDERQRDEDEDEDKDAEPVVGGGYGAVGFSYGHSDEATEQKNSDVESVYRPPFPVPLNLIQNLPPTEKIHHIMAKTASFVSKHGGQSEIVLRVKQGDNPTFGFLLPDHHLHPYFRFLVDNQGLLKYSEVDIKSLEQEKKDDNRPDQTGGALSLLGSVYGYDDDDGATEDSPNPKREKSREIVDTISATVSHGSNNKDTKDKVHTIKRNLSINTIKNPTSTVRSDGDTLASVSATTKPELPIVEPPAELKRVVEKIVEFILRNGKEFEAVLAGQDRKFGRFPFLLSSNQYHPYYLQVLQNTPNSKSAIKDFVPEKHGKKPTTADGDIPNEYDKKEKFKMVLGKSKKDEEQAPPPKPELVIDAEAAAAILKAATRGIKNPGLELFPKISRHNSDDTLEADSSETSLTREQKLKAERLKRAKMFTAMVKSGAAPLKPAEPLGSRVSSPANDAGDPPRIEKLEKKALIEESSERRSKRSYRSKSTRDIEEEEEDDDDIIDDGELNDPRKKHRSHRSSRHGRDRDKHRESRRRHHKRSTSSDEDDYRSSATKRQKHRSSDEHRHRHKHSGSSSDDDEARRRSKSGRRRKHKSGREAELEEGSIHAKPDITEMPFDLPPRPAEETVVSDDLRAKIRAMLMATM